MKILEIVLAAVSLLAVEQLGDRDFRVRECAFRRLGALVHLSPGPVLAGERHHDAEVRGRCNLLAGKYYAAHAAEIVDRWKPLNWKDWPRLDYFANWLFEWSWEFLDHYLAQTAGLAEPATRLWLIDLCKARQDFVAALEELCDLQRGHALANEGLHVPPVPKFRLKR